MLFGKSGCAAGSAMLLFLGAYYGVSNHRLARDDSEPVSVAPGPILNQALLDKEPDLFASIFQHDGDSHRMLQQGPSRACGEIIGTATREEINQTLTLLGSGLYGSVGPQLQGLYQSLLRIDYGIQARKICTSCENAAELWAGSPFLLDASPNGYATYCGPNAFGYNVTISGLLLVPIDEETGELVQGSLKTTVYGRVTSPRLQRVLSERWPASLADLGLEGLEGDNLASSAGFFYDLITPMAAAAAGTAVLAPDYLGYGQSYNFTQSWFTKAPYQASGATLCLFAIRLLEEETNKCTVLEPTALSMGYSAGGYSSIAMASAMRQMGVDILGVWAGAAPSRISSAQMVTAAGNANLGLNAEASEFALALLVYSYSSTNRDLVNTNKDGQNYVSDVWLENVTEWVEMGLAASTINELLPDNILDIVNENLTALMLEAYDNNETDICVDQISNVDTFAPICLALTDNDLTELLHSVDFPVTFCHSPQDFLVPIENLPDFTENPEFLSVFDDIPGFAVGGNHNQAGALCLISLIFPFANPQLTSIGPATECPTGETPSPTPMTGMTPQPTPETNTPQPTPTQEPSAASTWHRISIMLVTALVPLLFSCLV